ncbi:hypothetical protein J23TS9_50650 [Paenibacillus sp. J23TS9]|nr:hypothetical protein J23TS9_50650 [Paenibacillus sp. J23TS9]
MTLGGTETGWEGETNEHQKKKVWPTRTIRPAAEYGQSKETFSFENKTPYFCHLPQK